MVEKTPRLENPLQRYTCGERVKVRIGQDQYDAVVVRAYSETHRSIDVDIKHPPRDLKNPHSYTINRVSDLT